jgi:hypothetical protein
VAALPLPPFTGSIKAKKRWVIDRSRACSLLRRLFLSLYAISLLESADVLFSARYLDAADIWQEKKPHFFGV